jgi:thiol-disulfide isomerase/thioredoxin
MNEPKYRDIREAFWRKHFGAALPFGAFIEGGSARQRADWEAALRRTSLTDDQSRRLGTWSRKMNLLCLCGIWCGDCVRQGPMLHRIAQAAPVIDLRFIDNRANRDLQEELRLLGGERVPLVVALSEDFFEVGRFGDRTLSAYRAKAAAERGASCTVGSVPPPEETLRTEIAEWLDFLERIQLMLYVSPQLRGRYGD